MNTHYQIVRHKNKNGSEWLGVHEVFTDDEEHVHGFDLDPIVRGEDEAELVYQLVNILADVKRYNPVYEDFFDLEMPVMPKRMF